MRTHISIARLQMLKPFQSELYDCGAPSELSPSSVGEILLWRMLIAQQQRIALGRVLKCRQVCRW